MTVLIAIFAAPLVLGLFILLVALAANVIEKTEFLKTIHRIDRKKYNESINPDVTQISEYMEKI